MNRAPRKAAAYVDSFDADTQITAEEQIAVTIREFSIAYTLPDEDCAELGRKILKQVLAQFRPDLFVGGSK